MDLADVGQPLASLRLPRRPFLALSGCQSRHLRANLQVNAQVNRSISEMADSISLDCLRLDALSYRVYANADVPEVGPLPMNLIKSKRRVADHGEVFTPEWLVEKMLGLVQGETERIDSRFLEPACGSGNFLVPVLQRKLAAVEAKFGKSEFEKRQYSLLAVMCTYGIELLTDNIAECRANMLEVFADYLGLAETDELYRAASYVVSQNLVHGDALTMLTDDGRPITFAEWGYLGKGKFQRRDFRFEVLTQMSSFTREGSLFAHLGNNEIFTPIKEYPPITARELAGLPVDVALGEAI